MSKTLRSIFLLTAILSVQGAFAQRYLEEVFTDDQIEMETVVYATNIDFLTSVLDGANTALDIGTLSNIVDNDLEFPAAYYDPSDASTDVKITAIEMDIYYPNMDDDDVDARPVILYLHTGNFLPQPVNMSATGQRTDSSAVALCRGWAKRGYVAISADYRLGWRPDLPSVQERRGTLLNAVYRAIHDAKMAVRYMRADAMEDNTWEIDESRIAIFGQGSGSYIATSYATLDDAATELFLEKFIPDPFEPDVSYIDTLVVGVVEGWGYPNSVNLYRDNGISADVSMVINAGGSMADKSWLGPGDVPMVSVNCIRDDFAPFDEGIVVVPGSLQDVVPVHGANQFIQKCNDLGINDVFASLPDGDPYTDRARSLYGETFDASNATEITVSATPEGLFPIELPLTDFTLNQAAPWEWWDPTSPNSQIVTPLGITIHEASVASNPGMGVDKGMAYLDTIQGYILPRIMCVMNLPGNPCAGAPPANNDCAGAIDVDDLFHTNSTTEVVSDVYDNTLATPSDSDPESGFDCFGEPSFNVDPVLNNTMYYTFTGDGEDYTIETGDCGGGLADYIDFGDTQIQIFTGDCGSLVAAADGCSEDSDNAVTDNYFAGMNFTTVDGQDYIIMIDGFNGVGVDEVGVQADGEYCIHVTQLTVNVEELTAASFDLYPNPTTGNVKITTSGLMDKVIVHNLIGEVVEVIQTPLSAQVEINAQNLETGVYFVTVFAGNQQMTQKLIKE